MDTSIASVTSGGRLNALANANKNIIIKKMMMGRGVLGLSIKITC